MQLSVMIQFISWSLLPRRTVYLLKENKQAANWYEQVVCHLPVYEARFIALDFGTTCLAFLMWRASHRRTGPGALGQKTADTSQTPPPPPCHETLIFKHKKTQRPFAFITLITVYISLIFKNKSFCFQCFGFMSQ